MNENQTKTGGGIVLRKDLSLLIWNGDQGVEVDLRPEQALSFALNLIETCQVFLAQQQANATQTEKPKVTTDDQGISWIHKTH